MTLSVEGLRLRVDQAAVARDDEHEVGAPPQRANRTGSRRPPA